MLQERLSEKSLKMLAPDVDVPKYDRTAITPGIVHLGLGSFHRAHQAVFTDDCLNAGERDWAIITASLRSPNTRDALAPQDNLYTFATLDSHKERLRVVGSIRETIVGPESPDTLLMSLTDPCTRIVSLTITEKGYTANLSTGDLLAHHPDVIYDLKVGNVPRTALGFITEALVRRRKAGIAPFTLLSCDNLPHNGKTLHRILEQFVALRAPSLTRFIADEVRCPSTMVDRIVPATTDRDRTLISARLGVKDAWPVVSEPYFQWVVEDQFRTGRPHWERSGIEFVSDVAPFESMKLRLLNGAHSAIAAIGRIAGYLTVAEAIGDPLIRSFVRYYWNEVIPTLDSAIDSRNYTKRLLHRFDNTSLQHKTAQIASDASQKIPQRMLAPMRELRATGAATPALIFAVACWIRSCSGADGAGRPMPLNDPVFEVWLARPDQSIASAAEVIRSYLDYSTVFCRELREDQEFAAALATALDEIKTFGVLRAAQRLAQVVS